MLGPWSLYQSSLCYVALESILMLLRQLPGWLFFGGISVSLCWRLDPETVSDLGFHPLQKQQLSCTCSCRFDFSPTSGKLHSPLFLIKNVLAITVGSYPHWRPPHLFFPSIVGLMASSSATDEETWTLRGGSKPWYDWLPFLSLSLCLGLLVHLFLHGSWLSPSQQPGIVAWLSSWFKTVPCFWIPVPSWTPATSPRWSRKGNSSDGEKVCFPLADGFALPCTPPHPTTPHPPLPLRPGLHTAASGATAEYHCTPHRLTNNNRATEGVMEKLPCGRKQASRSQKKQSAWTHERDHKQR